MSSLGDTVRSLRLQLDMTQAQLAIKASIQQSSVSRIESGEMFNPTLDVLAGLASALDVPISTLLR